MQARQAPFQGELLVQEARARWAGASRQGRGCSLGRSCPGAQRERDVLGEPAKRHVRRQGRVAHVLGHRAVSARRLERERLETQRTFLLGTLAVLRLRCACEDVIAGFVLRRGRLVPSGTLVCRYQRGCRVLQLTQEDVAVLPSATAATDTRRRRRTRPLRRRRTRRGRAAADSDALCSGDHTAC